MRLKSLLAILLVLGISVALISPVAAMGKAPQKAQALEYEPVIEILGAPLSIAKGKVEGPATDKNLVVWPPPGRKYIYAKITDEKKITVKEFTVWKSIDGSYVLNVDVAVAENGCFVVAAAIAGPTYPYVSSGYWWLYDAGGNPLSEGRLPLQAGNQKELSVAIDNDGFLVIWTNRFDAQANIHALRHDSSGNVVGSVIPIATDLGRSNCGSGVIIRDHVFVVYHSKPLAQVVTYPDVFVGKFRLVDGARVALDQANTAVTYHYQGNAVIGRKYDSSGNVDGVEVVWHGDTGSQLYYKDIFSKKYRLDLTPVVYNEEVVNLYREGQQMYPDFSSSPGGKVYAYYSNPSSKIVFRAFDEKGNGSGERVIPDGTTPKVSIDRNRHIEIAHLWHDPVTYISSCLSKSMVTMDPRGRVGAKIATALNVEKLGSKKQALISFDKVLAAGDLKAIETDTLPGPLSAKQIGKALKIEIEATFVAEGEKSITLELGDLLLSPEEQLKLKMMKWEPGNSWVKYETKVDVKKKLIACRVPFDKSVEGYWVVTLPGDLAAAIQDLIDLVKFINLPQGIENSLDAKLENAARALQRATDGYGPEAANMLEAFVYECEAQKGKKLTVAQADELIAAAQPIIDDLRSSNL